MHRALGMVVILFAVNAAAQAPTTFRDFLTGYRFERWDEEPAAA